MTRDAMPVGVVPTNRVWSSVPFRVLVVCMVLGAALVLVGCGSGSNALEALNGTPLPYSVVESGIWPTTQTVGAPIDLALRTQNIGNAVPHFVLVLNGILPTWSVLKVKGCGQNAVRLKAFQSDPAWDFGPLQKKQECDITFHVVPRTAGNGQARVTVRSFGAVVDHTVGESVPVNGGLELTATISP